MHLNIISTVFYTTKCMFKNMLNRIGGVMVHVFISSTTTVNHGFHHRPGQTKDFKIGICCFSVKYAAALRSKNKDSCFSELTNPTRRVALVQRWNHHLLKI